MSTKNISAVFSDADKAEVMDAIAILKSKLHFLINLTTEARKRSRVMGPKSAEYVKLNLWAAKSHSSVIPSGVDIAELERDVNLVKQLISIKMPMDSLCESIDDTILAAGSDAMTAADLIYAYLKQGARNNAAVKDITARIAERFKQPSRKPDSSK